MKEGRHNGTRKERTHREGWQLSQASCMVLQSSRHISDGTQTPSVASLHSRKKVLHIRFKTLAEHMGVKAVLMMSAKAEKMPFSTSR